MHIQNPKIKIRQARQAAGAVHIVDSYFRARLFRQISGLLSFEVGGVTHMSAKRHTP
jgi:hypothetical protein